MATGFDGSQIDDELYDDVADYALARHARWLKRQKITITQVNEREYHLEYLYSDRTKKIEISGTSAEDVLIKFLSGYSEDMFNLEFVLNTPAE